MHKATVVLLCFSLFLVTNAQSCTINSVRLFNGTSSSSYGILQICNSSRVWSDVCDHRWRSSSHSIVVCKHLGYTNPTPITKLNAGPAKTGKFSYVIASLSSSYCPSTRTSITSCLSSTSYWLRGYFSCHTYRDTIYIDCHPDTSGANPGQARLYDTIKRKASNEGMLQMGDANRTWTAVCNYRWGCNHAVTACKQLGYSNPSPTYKYNAGPWTTIGYGYSYCSSTATNLTSCTSYSSYYRLRYCNPKRDTVYLKCNNNYVKPTCSPNYSIRLVGGSDASEGRLEVCYRGVWHGICGLYNQLFASVACNQLGFTSNNFSSITFDGHYSCGNISNYLSTARCYRLYNNIRSCSIGASSSSSKCLSSCRSSSCSGIKCYASSNCNEGEARLVNGREEREGRLEVCANGVWGTVCSSNFRRSAAYVACKQLGYNDSDDAIIYRYSSQYGRGDGPIVYGNLDCFGKESSLSQCNKQVYPSFYCSSNHNIVGLKCLDICNEGEVRLVGGRNSLEGTVEICIEKRWKLVSDKGWDDTDAKVVCKQLKHTGGVAVLNSLFGEPKRAIVYSNVNCRGTETELRDCAHNRLYPQKMDGDVAGVRCSPGSTTTSSPPTAVIPAVTTGITCTGNSFALKGCSQACYEKTDNCIGSKLLEATGNGCVCTSCTESRSEPSVGLTITLDDARNYRCDMYCKRMMKCFDGTCDGSKRKCVCRYCTSGN